MATSVDITDREKLKSLLLSLDPNNKPIWGKMNPQQMVEHMIVQVEYSDGKKVTTCDLSPEEAAQAKHKWIYTDAQILQNLILGPLPEHFQYAGLETAIAQLMKELADFDEYFKVPGITAVHAGYGAMNHKEWITWHNKHFAHHFKQFNLLS
jgi:hypothetical protein